jgi:HAD superfamily hydrolase (TIGR01490 family)
MERRGAAFFDLDKTILAKSAHLALGKPFYRGGLISRRAAVRAAYTQLIYVLYGADEQQLARFRDRFAAMCRGWEVAHVRRVIEDALEEFIYPTIYTEAATLIEDHQARGHDVVLVSTSGEEVVKPIGALLGIERVIATRMVVEDGRYTGEVAFFASGPHKAEAIRELAAAEGYDLSASYAYSDSISDVPMLETVGHPMTVNPDRALRRVALERGWPIRVFRDTTPLPQRRPSASMTSPSHVAAGALGAAATLAGLAWLVYKVRLQSRRDLSHRGAAE